MCLYCCIGHGDFWSVGRLVRLIFFFFWGGGQLRGAPTPYFMTDLIFLLNTKCFRNEGAASNFYNINPPPSLSLLKILRFTPDFGTFFSQTPVSVGEQFFLVT